jgi:hypothetical protein
MGKGPFASTYSRFLHPIAFAITHATAKVHVGLFACPRSQSPNPTLSPGRTIEIESIPRKSLRYHLPTFLLQERCSRPAVALTSLVPTARAPDGCCRWPSPPRSARHRGATPLRSLPRGDGAHPSAARGRWSGLRAAAE